MNEKIFLPGSDRQIDITLNLLLPENPRILVLGSFSENIAILLAGKFNSVVNLIVEDTDSFLNASLSVGSNEKIKLSIMNYDLTDFGKGEFDLVYAQASVSDKRRNKIIKEIKRILKPGGYFSLGEIVKLAKEVPPFVENIFGSSLLDPLFKDDLLNYYTGRNFSVVDEKDFTSTLREYYKNSADKLNDAMDELTENEKKYHKKLLNKISHETNAYLKLGAEKFIGFIFLLLQKGEN